MTKAVTTSDSKVGKQFSKHMVPRNKLDWPFSYRIKLTFKQKLSKKIRRDTSYWSKKSLPRWTLNSEHLCSEFKDTHIHKRNFTKAQSTHCTPHNNSGRLQDPTLKNEQTFFSVPHGTFSKIDHTIGHKTGLNRYRNIEIIHAPYQINTA